MIVVTPGWPDMPWFWYLANISTDSIHPAPVGEPHKSALQQVSAQGPPELKSVCLAPKATSIQQQGFFDEVEARVEAPQRCSTRSVYE